MYRLKKENIPILQLDEIKKCEEFQKNGLNQFDQTKFDSLKMSNACKNCVIKKIKKVVPSFNSYIKNDDINSSYILHNITQMNKNGVVMLIDKSQDIPHWVMSAMKCLANCKLKQFHNNFHKLLALFNFYSIRAKCSWK